MAKRSQNKTAYVDSFGEHITELRARYDRLLERENIEVLAVHAGQVKRQFLDDMEYPFKPNPHFKAWCPLALAANCWLLIRQGKKPTLVFYSPEDFWHQQEQIDNEFWLPWFHVELITTPDAVDRHLPYDKSRCVYVGEHIEVAQALGIEEVNPEPVLSYLHFHRLFKTDYEQACIREANYIAIKGHEAAETAFFAGRSEFDCLIAYMQATGQDSNDAPYGHIIGHNEHAAILHYAQQSRQSVPESERRSMMIDAGASCNGYASDISRSYAWKEGDYADLVLAMDTLCEQLGQDAKPGMTFGELHQSAHLALAKILRTAGLVNMDPEDMVRNQITSVFMPHGLGHMLGLQVHDVGGNLADERGLVVSPPELFPTLKTTRKIEPRMVFTIEPGVYFIEALLQRLVNTPIGRHVNWKRVDEFRPYGGIRVEDNIIIHRAENENLTRRQGLS